jgi:hypothetical protein
LGLFVAVEFARDPLGGVVELIDRAPEDVVEVRFEPAVAEGEAQDIEMSSTALVMVSSLGISRGSVSSWLGR